LLFKIVYDLWCHAIQRIKVKQIGSVSVHLEMFEFCNFGYPSLPVLAGISITVLYRRTLTARKYA